MASDVIGTYRPDRGIRVSRNGTVEFFSGDTVVLAVGFKDKRLAEGLKNRVTSLYLIGDCVKPRRMKETIEEGFCVGREI